MSITADEIRPSRATRTPKAVKSREVSTEISFVTSIKNYFLKHKMSKQWGYRNLSHGDIFIETLEVESIVFQQNLFVESTKTLTDKLSRLGFVEQTVFPDYERYQSFCITYYNERHNLAVSLFSPKMKEYINTAYLISNKTTSDAQSGLDIFLNTISVLVGE